MPDLALPCPRCSGARTDSHEDRHTETRQDLCRECADTGFVPSRTGETRGGSFDPETGRAFGDLAPASS